MQLQVSGRNLDVTEPIREYALRKLARIERHLTEDTRVDLELAIERNPSISANQYAELTVWTRGPVLRAHESAEDMYAAIDLAVDKLDRQVRRYRERPPPLAAASSGARHRGAAAALRGRRGRIGRGRRERRRRARSCRCPRS